MFTDTAVRNLELLPSDITEQWAVLRRRAVVVSQPEVAVVTRRGAVKSRQSQIHLWK